MVARQPSLRLALCLHQTRKCGCFEAIRRRNLHRNVFRFGKLFFKFPQQNNILSNILAWGEGGETNTISSVDGYISTEENIQTLISKSEVIYILKGERMSIAAAFCLFLSGSLISFFPYSFTFTISPFRSFRVLFCPDSVPLLSFLRL